MRALEGMSCDDLGGLGKKGIDISRVRMAEKAFMI